MKNRTQLEITPAMQAWAEEHGAYFDKAVGQWFVDGEIPGPLISRIVEPQRRRDYVAESVPQCECGARMVVRSRRRTGEPIWACTSVRCLGVRPFDAVDIESSWPLPVNRRDHDDPKFENKDRAALVISQAITLFRSEALATAWLKTPKVGLAGATPLDAVKTIIGCCAVERLLEERFS
jgi:hypothetical protein